MENLAEYGPVMAKTRYKISTKLHVN